MSFRRWKHQDRTQVSFHALIAVGRLMRRQPRGIFQSAKISKRSPNGSCVDQVMGRVQGGESLRPRIVAGGSRNSRKFSFRSGTRLLRGVTSSRATPCAAPTHSFPFSLTHHDMHVRHRNPQPTFPSRLYSPFPVPNSLSIFQIFEYISVQILSSDVNSKTLRLQHWEHPCGPWRHRPGLAISDPPRHR